MFVCFLYRFRIRSKHMGLISDLFFVNKELFFKYFNILFWQKTIWLGNSSFCWSPDPVLIEGSDSNTDLVRLKPDSESHSYRKLYFQLKWVGKRSFLSRSLVVSGLNTWKTSLSLTLITLGAYLGYLPSDYLPGSSLSALISHIHYWSLNSKLLSVLADRTHPRMFSGGKPDLSISIRNRCAIYFIWSD